MPLTSPSPARDLSPFPEALAREKKGAFVACALMGVNEAATWLRDPELTRLTGAALGRALALLQELAKATERETNERRNAGR
jgi:hypothetical protein